MLKNTFFLLAMKAGLYKQKSFIISAFSIIKEDFSKWKEDPFDYRLVQTPTGYFFVDPQTKELTHIEDGTPNVPLFHFKDPIELKKDDVPNLGKDITSTIGNLFFNYCCIVNSFGNKIPYIEGKANINALEDTIAKLLIDNPKDGKEKDPTTNFIYVDEYVKFSNSLLYITNFTQLCVWGATEKVLTPPPGLKEFRESLLKKYEGRLHDPTIVAMIDKELTDYDNQYLKGDPGENFLLNGSKPKTARKRLYLMYGAEKGFGMSTDVELVKSSLNEGWELDKFPVMNDALRAGSYNRGAETQLGGEAVKWLMRASSNINIEIDDCGTKLGKPFKVDETNKNKLIGFSILTEEGSKLIKEDTDVGIYLGKTVLVRSPMYCKVEKTDYCKACVGEKLAMNPTGGSLAITEYGSKMMNIFMSAMHTKAMTLAKYDFKVALT